MASEDIFLLVFIGHLYVDTSNNLCVHGLRVAVSLSKEQKLL